MSITVNEYVTEGVTLVAEEAGDVCDGCFFTPGSSGCETAPPCHYLDKLGSHFVIWVVKAEKPGQTAA